MSAPSVLEHSASRGVLLKDEAAKGRLYYLDALRAVAALLVFGVHVYAYWLQSPIQETHSLTPKGMVLRFLSLGDVGVDLFIVISGFCLALPLYKRRSRDELPRQLKSTAFWKRRAFRILPAYYLTLVLFFGIEQTSAAKYLVAQHPSGLDLLAHVFLIQSWFNSAIGSINGPYWSIALEAQLYLLFPLALVVVRRWGLRWMLAVQVCLAAVWWIIDILWMHTAASATFGGFLDHELPARWIEFGLGVAAARIVTAPKRRDFGTATAATIMGLPLGLAGQFAASPFINALGWGLFFFGVTVWASRVPSRVQTDFTAFRALRRLGVISFSFYLVHQPLLLVLNPQNFGAHLPFWLEMLASIAACAVVTVVAYGFYRLVERPFLVRSGMRGAIVDPEGVPVPAPLLTPTI